MTDKQQLILEINCALEHLYSLVEALEEQEIHVLANLIHQQAKNISRAKDKLARLVLGEET